MLERCQGTLYRKRVRASALRRAFPLRQYRDEMLRKAPWVGVLLVWAGIAQAQSLAAVAEREKARRARVRAEGAPSKIVDEEALTRARGESLSVTGKESPARAEKEERGEAVEPEGDEATRLTPEEVRELREQWSRVWRSRLEAAERERDIAADHVFQCQKAATFFFVPLGIDCNGVRERLAIAEYRLKEIRANRYNWELLLPEGGRAPPESEPPG